MKQRATFLPVYPIGRLESGSIGLAVSLFADDGLSLVVVHERYLVYNIDRDGNIEFRLPKVDNVLFFCGRELLVCYDIEGYVIVAVAHNLVVVNTLDVVQEVVGEVVNRVYVATRGNIGVAFSSHDAHYLAVAHLDKVLCVIADEGMGQVPEVGADHPADAVLDGMPVVVKNFDDSVVATHAVTIMGRSLIGVGRALATVGVDDVATEGLFNFFAVGIR